MHTAKVSPIRQRAVLRAVSTIDQRARHTSSECADPAAMRRWAVRRDEAERQAEPRSRNDVAYASFAWLTVGAIAVGFVAFIAFSVYSAATWLLGWA